MAHRLYIVEGLPCSGKSTISAHAALLLEKQGRVCFVDEGTGDHPADYEFHALAPAGVLGAESRIVPLSQYSGDMFDRLLPHKIYDFLSWETEQPLMLAKWRAFVKNAQPDIRYVFNCVLLQNPMCETMMRFNLPEEASAAHIRQIAEIIRPLAPLVIYLHNDDVARSVQQSAGERPGWLEAVIGYHVDGGYGRSVGAAGFDGYIACLAERQRREERILEALPLRHLTLVNPQRNWPAAHAQLRAWLKEGTV